LRTKCCVLFGFFTDQSQGAALVPAADRFHSRPWTLPSEKVTTQLRIGIGYSTEERQRIIRCCPQVLQEPIIWGWQRNSLKAAAGIPVEWRVVSRTAASKLQELFTVNDVPINVVFVP
jgi:hypothetical protein